jgi:hypothetical protein
LPWARISPVSRFIIRTKAPPTPEPITLASFETTRTMIFVVIFSAEKDSWIKKMNREIKVIKDRINLSLDRFISPLTLALSPKRLCRNMKKPLSKALEPDCLSLFACNYDTVPKGRGKYCLL